MQGDDFHSLRHPLVRPPPPPHGMLPSVLSSVLRSMHLLLVNSFLIMHFASHDACKAIQEARFQLNFHIARNLETRM